VVGGGLLNWGIAGGITSSFLRIISIVESRAKEMVYC